VPVVPRKSRSSDFSLGFQRVQLPGIGSLCDDGLDAKVLLATVEALHAANMRQAVYITFSELFQRHPSREELVDILKDLSAMTSVMFALRINNIFRFCAGKHASEMPKFQIWFAREYLDGDTRGHLLASVGTANASSRPYVTRFSFSILRSLPATSGGMTKLLATKVSTAIGPK
jgi:hypothetical protein